MGAYMYLDLVDVSTCLPKLNKGFTVPNTFKIVEQGIGWAEHGAQTHTIFTKIGTFTSQWNKKYFFYFVPLKWVLIFFRNFNTFAPHLKECLKFGTRNRSSGKKRIKKNTGYYISRFIVNCKKRLLFYPPASEAKAQKNFTQPYTENPWVSVTLWLCDSVTLWLFFVKMTPT